MCSKQYRRCLGESPPMAWAQANLEVSRRVLALHQDRRTRRCNARPRPLRWAENNGGDVRDRQRTRSSISHCSCPATASPRRWPTNSPEATRAELHNSSLIELGLILFIDIFIDAFAVELLLLQLSRSRRRKHSWKGMASALYNIRRKLVNCFQPGHVLQRCAAARRPVFLGWIL